MLDLVTLGARDRDQGDAGSVSRAAGGASLMTSTTGMRGKQVEERHFVSLTSPNVSF